EIDKNSIIVNSKMETNIPGIYAAGDINTYPGKVKLIATGFGDGPIAVNNAMQYLDPNARIQPRHSTSMFQDLCSAMTMQKSLKSSTTDLLFKLFSIYRYAPF